MKNKLFAFILSLLFICPTVCAGCDFGSRSNNKSTTPTIDNSRDLQTFTPAENDGNEYDRDKTYYKSNSVSLITEIHGNYSSDRPFTLDENDENKRIYQNVYLYVDDYFQIIYYRNVNALGEIFAVMSDKTDEQYAQVQYTAQGKPLQIDVKQQGKYNLILDLTTFGIDMEKIGDIDTPVYETIKSCNIHIFNSVNDSNYYAMELNRETNEFFIQREIPLNAAVRFTSDSHNSHYMMTVPQQIIDKFVYPNQNENPDTIYIHVGGIYKVYFNAKTYELKMELQNPDSATYFCQVGFRNGQELTAKSTAPYSFEYEFTANGAPGEYIELPDFYPKLGMPYILSVIDENGLTYGQYVKQSGKYKLTVNLKDFTLAVEKIA